MVTKVLCSGIFIALTFLLSVHRIEAQVNTFVAQPDPHIFQSANKRGWVTFREDQKINPADIFIQHGNAFGLNDQFQMKPVKISYDSTGYTHYKFQEYYQDLPIYDAIYLIHANNGYAVTGNGTILISDIPETTEILPESDALSIALSKINTTGYYWEDEKREAEARKKHKNGLTTYYPKGELMYLPEENKENLQLVYSFQIYTSDHEKSGRYFVSATAGDIVKFIPSMHSCDGTTFQSSFYGNKSLLTNDVAVIGHSYDLEDDCQSSVYGVYDETNDDDIFNSETNTWTGNWNREAATSLWAVKHAYLSYFFKFSLDGHDNDDGNLDLHMGHVFENGGNNNAAYSYDPSGDDEIYIGKGNTDDVTDDYNTLDILGHEFTHGVTTYSAGLEYEYESGALNESFSDIFGEWIESDEFGESDWFVGNDRINQSGCPTPLRYFINPADTNVSNGSGCNSNFDQPNTYGGMNWVSQSGCNAGSNNDQCGVHTNSGVQNQMFYFLSEGGSGWNDGQTSHGSYGTGYEWSVTGIGIDHAIQIAFKALYYYLTPSSDYHDARNAWVQAANIIFGVCSPEAIATGKAWYAVGIGPPSISDLVLCNESYGDNPVTISALGGLATSENCFVHITNGGELVKFQAGNYVKLKPGFHATSGSLFKAELTDCDFAIY